MSFCILERSLYLYMMEIFFGEKKVKIVTDFVKNRISHFPNLIANFEC